MKKHIDLLLRLKMHFKNFKKLDLYYYSCDDETRSHLKVYADNAGVYDMAVSHVKVFYDNELIFDRVCKLLDINDICIVSNKVAENGLNYAYFTALPSQVVNYEAKELIIKGDIKNTFYNSKEYYTLTGESEDGKISFLDKVGKSYVRGAEKIKHIDDYKWVNSLIYVVKGKTYIASKNFEKVSSYDYITKFGALSSVYIGIRYNELNDEKMFYLMTCPDDIGSDTFYMNILPGERSFRKKDDDIYEVSPYVGHYICQTGKRSWIVMDYEGKELYDYISITEVYPFSYGEAFARTTNRGIVLLKSDGSVVETDIKKINFPFRPVKYGLFEEVLAGIELFDGEYYMDLDGNIKVIFNQNRYNAYYYDCELHDE